MSTPTSTTPPAAAKPTTPPAAAAAAGKPITPPAAAKPTTPPAAKPAAFDASMIADGGFTLAEQLATITQPVNKRSDLQVAVDKQVQAVYDKWVTAGKPSGSWPNLIKARAVVTYFLPPVNAAEFRAKANKSATFLKYSIRWGQSFVVTSERRAEFAKQGVNIPAEFDGREAVSFAVRDQVTRTREAKTSK